ncbi:hypothetical protein [Alicyclobacillus ferrooxydans]|uniref:Uncharacterized protein n=1 Tax=Alicyclobacillus ferrooxydans TaxID=471514 RepID=A0A0P9GUB6_9BACL|nr:hypothetical protein [Alicyclobacillus ferrooxydans]KPV44849.1 hypothetical protein AN477_04995 [Alicyclobacillus ferrooxydans]
MSRIRLVPMLLILLVSLAVFFAGWQVYKRYNLVDPVKTDLQSVSGVQNVDVLVGNPTVIRVKLGPVQDLQTTYDSIAEAVTGSVNAGSTIVIVDNKNKALQQEYENLFPSIMQGVSHGDYKQMITDVEKEATIDGFKSKITMDHHNIYLQLEQGTHYLYDVWNYNPTTTTLQQAQQAQGGATS